MLSSNTLPLNLFLQIDVTCSTSTGVLASVRRLFALFRVMSAMGMLRQLPPQTRLWGNELADPVQKGGA
jgi:hypothetical protein